jgi:hypothetical protein
MLGAPGVASGLQACCSTQPRAVLGGADVDAVHGDRGAGRNARACAGRRRSGLGTQSTSRNEEPPSSCRPTRAGVMLHLRSNQMTRGLLLCATLSRKAVLQRSTGGHRRETSRKHACGSRKQSDVLGARSELRGQRNRDAIR